MGVRIDINTGKIVGKVKNAWQAALYPLSEQVLTDCNEFCKQANGDLIASSQQYSRPRDGILVWKTAYARRQYWEIRTASHDKNPRATWRWCAAAKRAYKKDWEKLAEKLMKENL